MRARIKKRSLRGTLYYSSTHMHFFKEPGGTAIEIIPTSIMRV